MSSMSKIHYDQENPIMVGPTKFCHRTAALHVTEYAHDGSPALCGNDPVTGEPLWKATVCIPDNPPEDGCVWIKNYSENEGVLDALQRAGVIEFTGRFAQVGHAHAFECALLV